MKKTTLAALAALAVYSGAANAVLPMLLMMPLMMGGMMGGPGGDAATAPPSGCEHDHDAGAAAPASADGPLPVRPGTAGAVADPDASGAPEFGLPSSGTH